MKAVLEFDFDKEDSDDRIHFQDAIDGSKWKFAMWKMDQYLRTNTKYASDSTSEDAVKALYDARDELYRIINEQGLLLD
jgi:hypothetical protein